MLSQMRPYHPTLYRPGGQGRYRAYPRVTQTPIPGAGYDAGELMWAEQELDLQGGDPLQPYGDYERVPLRGLGSVSAATVAAYMRRSPTTFNIMPSARQDEPPAADTYEAPDTSIPPPPDDTPRAPEDYGFEMAAQIEEHARSMANRSSEEEGSEEGFFDRKVGPVPVWAIGVGGVAALGGLAFFMMRRRR